MGLQPLKVISWREQAVAVSRGNTKAATSAGAERGMASLSCHDYSPAGAFAA